MNLDTNVESSISWYALYFSLILDAKSACDNLGVSGIIAILFATNLLN
jgi:hypothetical protein